MVAKVIIYYKFRKVPSCYSYYSCVTVRVPPPRIPKQGGLKSSGKRLISINSKMEIILNRFFQDLFVCIKFFWIIIVVGFIFFHVFLWNLLIFF